MGKTRRTGEKGEIVFYRFILVPRAAPPRLLCLEDVQGARGLPQGAERG